MSISRARTIAFDVLLRVTTQNAYADDELRAALPPSVRSDDAGLATELVLGVLRWQRLLDFVLDDSLKKPGARLDVEVRIALRLGAYQLLFLDRVPARAAVHESVELTKRARKSSAASLVNAVLRKVADELPPNPTPAAPAPRAETLAGSKMPKDLPAADRLGILSSHPTWMVERWLRNFGEEGTRALLAANNRSPVHSAYLLAPDRRNEAFHSLQDAGCNVAPGLLLRDSLSLVGGTPAASEAIRRGWVTIQDEASQAVARLLGVRAGETVLDLCAAPGGKTLLLARAAGPEGHVIAGDLHEHRIKVMNERLANAGIRNVETCTLDGLQPLPSERPFDRILVDVPCSGTGTLARHPEIRWKLREEDLSDLHNRQSTLLRNALSHLTPRGRLVYSTCSLEPEENELVVTEALKDSQGKFHVASARRGLEAILSESVRPESLVSTDGFFCTFPPEHGTDGFFAALIER